MDGNSSIACLYAPESVHLNAFAEACLQLTPTVALRNSEAVFLNFQGCDRLWTSQGLRLRLQVLQRRFQIQGQWAWAKDAGQALVEARYGVAGVQIQRPPPLEALLDYFEPLRPLSDEERRPIEKLIKAMRHLGLSRPRDLLDLPVTDLGSRFGPAALEIYQHLSRGYHKPWPRLTQQEVIQESLAIEFFENPQGVESLVFLLKNLMDRALSRVRVRGCRLSALELRLISERSYLREEPNARTLPIHFPVPQSASREVLRIIHEKVTQELQRRPMCRALTDIDLRVTEMAPDPSQQKDFFLKTQEETEKLETLMLRLWEKLGRRTAFGARKISRHRPEASWQRECDLSALSLVSSSLRLKTQEEDEEALLAERPLRLLPQPLQLIKDGPLLWSTTESKKWLGVGWSGPERLETEWWYGAEDLFRDYFTVTTEKGERLWVYQDREKRLFLHGFFD